MKNGEINAEKLFLTREIKDMVDDLIGIYPDLTSAEALSSALQMERNAMIKRAFVLTKTDYVPTALEKIVHGLDDIANAITVFTNH